MSLVDAYFSLWRVVQRESQLEILLIRLLRRSKGSKVSLRVGVTPAERQAQTEALSPERLLENEEGIMISERQAAINLTPRRQTGYKRACWCLRIFGRRGQNLARSLVRRCAILQRRGKVKEK